MGGSTKRTMSNKDKNKLFDIAIKEASKGKKDKDLRAISDKDMKKFKDMKKLKMNRGGGSKVRGTARGGGAATKGKGYNV